MDIKKNFLHLAVVSVIGFLVVTASFLSFYDPGLATSVEDQHSYLPLISRLENTPTPTPISGEDWLSLINYLRFQADLPGVSSNPTWSDGCYLHSRYMVWNDEVSHNEDHDKLGYTIEGDEAAGESNVMVSGSNSATDKYAIDLWMSGPFHGIAILDPQLQVVGFGSYREAIGTWQMGASLDVSRGRVSSEPLTGTYPVMWPGNGQSTDILGYRGTEWPDPLTSCPGMSADYWNPSGPPIYLQIGSGDLTPDVSTTSFKQGSTHLEHCVFDETNYTNPSSSTQNTGRWILNTRDAIIIMPKEPLETGKNYYVSVTSNGFTYAWSFTTESSKRMDLDLPGAFMWPPTSVLTSFQLGQHD